VLHYAGHAYFDPVDPSRSGILCSGREVLSGADLANLGSLPSLAFFNACESGRLRQGSSAAKIDPNISTEHRVRRGNSFAEAFLRGGIANYLGTYWPVGDSAAGMFAEHFYGRLLAGEALGDAIMNGRKALQADGTSDWADYVFYGDPAFVLKKRDTNSV
jgi:CHAT domain-containing protein